MVKNYNTTLTKKKKLKPTVKALHFKLDNNESLDFKTGQWLMLDIPNGTTPIRRPMSIASPDKEKTNIEFCIKLNPQGQGTKILHTLQSGTSITLNGPFGQFILKYPTEADIILIATGSGIAPLKAMIQDLLLTKKAKNNIYLLFGNRTEDEIVYKDLFETLARTRQNFHFLPILSKPQENWNGERGRVQDLLKKHFINHSKSTDFYLCGMKDMILETLSLLETMGFPRKNIHFERYN